MNVFVVPSWYPSRSTPLGGIFIREQVDALADLYPQHCFLVSTWGHDDSVLRFRDPRCLASTLRWRIRASPKSRHHAANHVEIFHPTLTWSSRLPWGGASGLISANRSNFETAREHVGAIDLIHAHVGYPGGVIAAVLSDAFAVPYVITEHMGPFPFPYLLRQGRPLSVLDNALRKASATIAVSPSLAQRIASFGYPQPRVIPNMVDERVFFPSTMNRNCFNILAVGSLTEHKGFDLLLEAIAHWNPPAGTVEFQIVGDGPDGPTLRQRARDLGVDDRVRWFGQMDRHSLPALFQAASAYVLPSRHETFGMVCAEAIACGCPVVATRCGGPESIVDETNGILVDSEDPESLAVGMGRIFRERSRYCGDTIREGFLKRFSRAVVASQIVGVYEAIVAGA